MKLATWNVNSLKVRLPQVLDWLAAHQPDVLCLQETKLEDVNFPMAEISAAGYQAVFSGQKTYNGVAILSKPPSSEVVTAIPGFMDAQKRVLAATIAGVRVINLYIPNGQTVDSDKYQYKLGWLE
ncbi:MAG: exodeoxyribonuclease III, partial [Sulfuricella sp.]